MNFDGLIRKATDISKAAIDLNNEENNLRYRHVAFILRGKTYISVGWNKRKTHPNLKRYSYRPHCDCIHAEMDAIIKHGKTDCSQNSMIVMRIRKDGSVGNSKPCKGCQRLIDFMGFKEVWYSGEEGNFERL